MDIRKLKVIVKTDWDGSFPHKNTILFVVFLLYFLKIYSLHLANLYS